MKKNIEMQVKEETPLLEYLFSNITNKSKNNVKSLLSRGNIEVNGKVTTKFDYLLKKGQIVTINTSRIHDKNNDDTIDVLYEDKDLIIINKPEGLLSIGTDNEKTKTAYKMVMEYMKRQNHGSKLFVVHRLDRDTSGVLMFAKNEKIKYLLQDNWDKLVKVRGYVAIVEGIVKKESGTIKSWLKETKTMLVYSSNKQNDGDLAITHYKKIKNSSLHSLLEIKIDTGRKNQIRVHMSDLGHPIIGDKKYGSKNNPLKRLGLHANVLEFTNPINNKIMHIEAKVPDEFYKLMRKNQ